jgi:putative peptidoglycan lipid II flippase
MVEREADDAAREPAGLAEETDAAPPPRGVTGFGRFLRSYRGALYSNSVMIAAGIVAAGFIGSRILGLVRSIAIANVFGTEPELAAYFVAFRLPDLVFQLLAGGTVSAAFIPIFSRVAIERGDLGAWRLASSVLNLLAIATAALAALAFLLAPLIVPLLAPGLGAGSGQEAELKALAVDLTRLMLLSPLFFGVSGMLTGILNGRQHFVAPALAPILYNAGIIFGALVLTGPLGVYGLAWGVVIGAVGHLAVQLPAVVAIGMRWGPTLDLAARAVRDVLRLMVPRMIGLAATQVNFLILIFFASFISDAAISAINFAFLVMMMPVGVIGMAISTAAFPTLAQQAAAGQAERLRDSLARSLRTILFLAVPASAGLILLATPVVRLLFQHGAFDARSTQLVAGALVFYAVGIAAHAAVEILSRGFYALADTKTPVQVAVLAMLVNVVLAALLVWPFELRGLATAASVAAFVEFTLLVVLLRRALGGFGRRGVWRSISRTLIATFLMAEVVLVMRLLLEAAGADSGRFLGALLVVGACSGVGLLTYVGASYAFNREEYEATFGRVFR